jgi:hypothetical protein
VFGTADFMLTAGHSLRDGTKWNYLRAAQFDHAEAEKTATRLTCEFRIPVMSYWLNVLEQVCFTSAVTLFLIRLAFGSD